MGSSKENKANEVVSVSTDALKDKLNRVYQGRRGQGNLSADTLNPGLFDYLWDLKEKALMERRSSVEVPGNWLDELQDDAQRRSS